MKKIYRKPSLNVESFVSEEVMGSKQNLLSDVTINGFQFLTPGTGNTLTSIDYSEFTN